MTMTRKPIRPIKLEKPNRKINFDKEDIEADGKITLELFTNDITRLLVDLQFLGEPVVSFGNTVVHRFDASRIPDLEKLDSIAFGRVPSRPVRTNPPIPTSQLGDTGGTDKNPIALGSRKEGRKVSFAKADVDARGKIALDLVATDINQLVRDLYDIGVDSITTFGNNASVQLDASKIPALEQLPSLAFGRTTQREVSIGTIGEDENQRGTKNKSQTEVGDSAGQDNREASTAGVVSLSAPKEASQDNKGADLSVTRVKRQPRGESDLFTVRQTGASGFTSGRGSISSESNDLFVIDRGRAGAAGFTSGGTPGMVVTRGERSISYDGINFTSWKEGTPQPMPTESKPSTTIIIRSASFDRNAFGQPIPRPRFTSVSHTVGGSSSGGSSNSQVRAGSSANGRSSNSQGRRFSAGGQRVQWSRG